MMRAIKILVFVIFVFVMDVQFLYNSNWSSASERQFIISRLQNLYNTHDYSAFHDSLQTFLQSGQKPIRSDLKFKFAYASFKMGDYIGASKIFSELTRGEYLPKYSRFFKVKCLWHIDTLLAQTESKKFIKYYRNSPLADSLLVPLAQSLFKQKKFKQARTYFRLAIRHKVQKDRRVEFKVRAARCLYGQGKTTAALAEFNSIIKKYPGNEATEKLIDWLENQHPAWYKDHLLTIYPVLRLRGRLDEARVKLERFIRSKNDPDTLLKARFNLLRNYYAQGRYRTALYGFKKILNRINDPALKARCQLYIARSYLAIGNVTRSIESYLQFADQFPHHRMAPEVVWKVAMLLEGKGQLEKALTLYKKLHKKWPQTDLGKEGYFRQGYTLYRLGRYEEAEVIFNKIRFSLWKKPLKHRAQYWVSLCREMKGDTLTAHRVRRDLAKEMWDDYYTLKSYLLEKDYLDSTLQIIKELKQVHNPLHYYGKGFQNHLNEFERIFLLNDLLGPNYARLELSALKIDRSNLQEWIAVAEAYKRLNLYGMAYKTYDKINRLFYKDVSYSQKLFILKERFPYYYDALVDKYCRRYGLEKEFVLAIIKQESAFDHLAHSYADAYGLMQLILPTARDMAQLAGMREFNVRLLFRPEVNIHLGTLYLKQLQRMYHGDKARILAAYNAGPHRVKRWEKMPSSHQTDFLVENIEFNQTRNYVRHVLKNYWAYKLLYNNFQIDRQKLLTLENETVWKMIELAMNESFCLQR